MKRRYAFAGFFPYDEPKYSCIALVMGNAGNSANRTSGQVVKNMAVKMYSRGMLENASTFTADKKDSRPVMAAGLSRDNKKLASEIGASSVKRVKTPAPPAPGTVPYVVGYDAATAVKILEKAGLEVRISGAGIVRRQSLDPGTPLKKGNVIHLTLRV